MLKENISTPICVQWFSSKFAVKNSGQWPPCPDISLNPNMNTLQTCFQGNKSLVTMMMQYDLIIDLVYSDSILEY